MLLFGVTYLASRLQKCCDGWADVEHPENKGSMRPGGDSTSSRQKLSNRYDEGLRGGYPPGRIKKCQTNATRWPHRVKNCGRVMTWLIDGCGWLLTWVSHFLGLWQASLSILLALINTLSVALRLCWLRRVEIKLLRSVWRLSGCAKVMDGYIDDSWWLMSIRFGASDRPFKL